MVTVHRPPHLLPNSEIYKVPCGACNKVYIGETSRSFAKRKEDHRRDLNADRSSNAFVRHRQSVGHLPRWTDAKVVAKGLPRQKRKILESALIANESEVLNIMTASHRLAKVTAAVIVAESLK